MSSGSGLIPGSTPCLSSCPDRLSGFKNKASGTVFWSRQPGWLVPFPGPPTVGMLGLPRPQPGPVTTCEDVLESFLDVGGIQG